MHAEKHETHMQGNAQRYRSRCRRRPGQGKGHIKSGKQRQREGEDCTQRDIPRNLIQEGTRMRTHTEIEEYDTNTDRNRDMVSYSA